jgi:hypothetical protein
MPIKLKCGTRNATFPAVQTAIRDVKTDGEVQPQFIDTRIHGELVEGSRVNTL